MAELKFPATDYYLDQSDPDAVILRRQDGSFVAAFSARGATREGILEAAKEDRRKRLRSRAIDYIVHDRSGGELRSSR
jgi:hypothetical protein